MMNTLSEVNASPPQQLITIIIPVYNVGDYIEECIMSACSQTYKCLEIILVDDGSTDNSLSICERVAKSDNRIKIFKKRNGGLSDARNYGIAKSKGEFIFFLDGDDMIQKDTIEFLYNSLNGYRDSIAMCNLESFYDKASYCNCRPDILIYDSKEYIESVMRLKNNTFACGVIMPRKFINDCFFKKGRFFEDMASMYKVYSQCDRIIKVNCNLYKYRRNPNSIVHTVNAQKVEDRLKSAKDFIDFSKKHYGIDQDLLDMYLCEAYASCYSMSKEDFYLKEARKIAKKLDLDGLSLRHRIKFLLLRNSIFYKIVSKLKRIVL